MVDPATGRFEASWQAEGETDVLEEVETDGAEAAIEWGRARAEFVYIRLGNRGDTYFYAGAIPPQDEDDEPIPAWPPLGPPPGGWWAPPVRPTLEEAEAVAAAVAAGRQSPKEAARWAFDRIEATIEPAHEPEDPVLSVLFSLTSGWIQINDEIRPATPDAGR